MYRVDFAGDNSHAPTHLAAKLAAKLESRTSDPRNSFFIFSFLPMVALRLLAVAAISTLTGGSPGPGAGIPKTEEATASTARLHRAILLGPIDEVRRMLKAGVEQSLGPGKQTALHLAAYRGHAGLVAAILQHGADVNAQHTADSEPSSTLTLHLHISSSG